MHSDRGHVAQRAVAEAPQTDFAQGHIGWRAVVEPYAINSAKAIIAAWTVLKPSHRQEALLPQIGWRPNWHSQCWCNQKVVAKGIQTLVIALLSYCTAGKGVILTRSALSSTPSSNRQKDTVKSWASNVCNWTGSGNEGLGNIFWTRRSPLQLRLTPKARYSIIHCSTILMTG